jgi:hypothetical protein
MGYVVERVRCRSHNEVYSGESFPQLNRWFWICTECLETGSNKLEQAPTTDPKAYWKAMRELKPDCWVPAKYK